MHITERFSRRSPSPEPIYGNDGKRLNTREYRVRKRMEDDRHALIQKLTALKPEYHPPTDYRPPQNRITDKVWIPQDDNPHINFVGLLIGPRGNTLKQLEKESGAKIIIRGKGSIKDGKVGRKDGLPMPGEDEPLHAYISASNTDVVQKAVRKINEIIRQGIEVPEAQNDLRKQQLRDLALFNGTLRENEGLNKLKMMAEAKNIATNQIQCTICGGFGHIASDCKFDPTTQPDLMNSNPAERAKMDSEYTALMSELGCSGPKAPIQSTLPTKQESGGNANKRRQPPPPGVNSSYSHDDDLYSTPTSTVTPVSNECSSLASLAAPPVSVSGIYNPPPFITGPPPSAYNYPSQNTGPPPPAPSNGYPHAGGWLPPAEYPPPINPSLPPARYTNNTGSTPQPPQSYPPPQAPYNVGGSYYQGGNSSYNYPLPQTANFQQGHRPPAPYASAQNHQTNYSYAQGNYGSSNNGTWGNQPQPNFTNNGYGCGAYGTAPPPPGV